MWIHKLRQVPGGTQTQDAGNPIQNVFNSAPITEKYETISQVHPLRWQVGEKSDWKEKKQRQEESETEGNSKTEP